MSYIILLLLLLLFVITTTVVHSQHSRIEQFQSDVLLKTDDVCTTTQNGVQVNGQCMSIQNCPTILASVVADQKPYNHTVCGYKDGTQIICCPINRLKKLNLLEDIDCLVANSNEKGTIKFLSECPQLNGQDVRAHVNRLCAAEICSDLVCCPGRIPGRLKNVCWYVDHPYQTLQLRLKMNQQCTVKGLNIKGRYQLSCAFAERNPSLKSLLQNVCNDDSCKDWYCCPLDEGYEFECTAVYLPTVKSVGPKCVDSKSGREGRCKQIYDCKIHDKKSLDKCGSYCCADYYWCPDIEVTDNQPIYVRGKRLAAGGIIARPGEFPHMAALGYKPMQEILWQCGGSLVSNRYVLTAGHCLTNHNWGSVHKVRLGVINLLNDPDTADCPVKFDVVESIPHPEYDPKFVYNDIGLIELATQVSYNYHIRPLRLPLNESDEMLYESMGWGATGTGEEASVKLIKVYQYEFTYEECQRQYDVGRRYPNGIMNSTQICAGSEDSIQSTCSGDSGGPLVARDKTNDAVFYIYGIVSFGSACGFANSPGIYTRVLPYVKWIEAAVWKN